MRLTGKAFGGICAACIVLAAGWERPALSQPAPSFRAGCATVQAELARLNPAADTLMTIDVVGNLTLVEFDGTIAYMGLCGSPTPKVMCIGYSIEGWKLGDPAILTGGVNTTDDGTIVLDPCLPSRPGEDDLKLIDPSG